MFGMFRLAGRVPTLQHAFLIRVSKSVECGHCIITQRLGARNYSNKAPPMSEPMDTTKASFDSTPPRRSSVIRFAAWTLGLTLGLTVLGLGVVGFVFLDPLELFMEKKPLSVSPNRTSSDWEAIPNPGESLIAQIDTPDRNAARAGNFSQQAVPSNNTEPKAKSVQVTEPIAREPIQKSNSGRITGIAEDSINFLVSGTRTAGEEAVLRRCAQAETTKKSNNKSPEREQKTAKSVKGEDEQTEQKTCELERTLSREVGNTVDQLKVAVRFNQIALDAKTAHASELKKAMDAETDSVAQEHWHRVNQLQDLSLERLIEARAATNTVEQKLTHVVDLLNMATKDDSLSSRSFIPRYRTQTEIISLELSRSVSALKAADSVERVMSHYHQLFKNEEEIFLQELAESLPDFKLGNKDSELTVEELRALLSYTHQRVLQLKKQLLLQENMKELRSQEIVRGQSQLDESVHAEEVAQLLQEERLQFEKEKELLMTVVADEQKKVARGELARQALAQANHIRDMLALQGSELTGEYQQSFREQVERLRVRQTQSLAEDMTEVDQLSDLLKERVDVEKTVSDLRRLTSSTQLLLLAVAKQDPADSTNYHLSHIAEAVKGCRDHCPENDFVQTILDAIPERAITNGVYTSSSLERRFDNVFSECKKNSLFPTSTNLLTTAFSPVYEKFKFTAKPKFSSLSKFYEYGTEGMDTQDLLLQAKFFVEKHHLCEAVKCLVQMEGLPRSLAHDWIEEARAYLEVLQASQVLHSYAMGRGLSHIL